MKRVLNSATGALALLCATTVASCAPDPRVRAPIQLVSNADINVTRATAHLDKDGIRVDGDVRRTNGHAGKVPGHLHITAFNAAGEVVAATDTGWGEFMNRRFRLAYYRGQLVSARAPDVARITVEPIATTLP